MNNIKIYQFLIFFIICLGFLQSQAYSISGTILDFETKEPIENVNAYIENYNIGSTTDDKGFFYFILSNQTDDYIYLTIEMVGYDNKSIFLDLSTEKIDLGEIFMNIKSLELDSVHIHAHKNISSQISDISLSGQKLNDNLIGNIATTLSNQPNIGVNSFGTVTSNQY